MSERAKLWRRRWEQAITYYGPLHEQIRKELRFALKLEHYENTREGSNDSRSVQYRGRELYSKLRRMTADVMAAPRYINARPVNPMDSDPRLAEVAKFALEHDVRAEEHGFEEHLERTVLGALAARVWVMWFEYDADYDKIVFQAGDPCKTFLTPGFNEVWDCSLPWLIREVPMRVADAKRKFPGIVNIVADNRTPDYYNANETLGSPSQRSGTHEAQEDPGDEGVVTVLLCWSRFEAPTVEVESGLDESGNLVMDEMPHPAYPDGRRYEVIFPYMQVSDEESDGPWPHDPRSYPCLQLKRNTHPTDYCGLSETKADHSLQVISNATMQRMWLQAQASPNILISAGLIEDAAGNMLDITDDPWLMGYVKDPVAMDTLKHFKADPIAQSMVAFYNLVNNSLRQDLGGAELGLTPGQSKDIPVGTVEAIVESGDAPTNHFIRRMRRELSIAYGIISDMQRSTWTAEKWVRMQGPNGMESWDLLSGADIPNADFTLSADPGRKAFDSQRAKSIMDWYSLPPPLRQIMAPLMDIEPSTIQQLEMAEQRLRMQAMVEQERMRQMGIGPAGPGDGPIRNGAERREPRFAMNGAGGGMQ